MFLTMRCDIVRGVTVKKITTSLLIDVWREWQLCAVYEL